MTQFLSLAFTHFFFLCFFFVFSLSFASSDLTLINWINFSCRFLLFSFFLPFHSSEAPDDFTFTSTSGDRDFSFFSLLASSQVCLIMALLTVCGTIESSSAHKLSLQKGEKIICNNTTRNL